jgi:hypothetical protein
MGLLVNQYEMAALRSDSYEEDRCRGEHVEDGKECG